MNFFVYAIPAAIIAASVYFTIRSFRKTGSASKAIRINFAVFALLFLVCLVSPFVANAAGVDAETPAAVSITDAAAEEAPAPTVFDPSKGLGMLSAALVTGLSGIGGGIAVAAGAPAAIGATSEDDKVFGKALIFVALGESIALYGLLVSIMILGKY
ncbi:MAG: hypothetical protein E7559_01225 [Ruminococcaceae bacterium]|nr:hypothetical protein [Oscillospiraceae bacterium]